MCLTNNGSWPTAIQIKANRQKNQAFLLIESIKKENES